MKLQIELTLEWLGKVNGSNKCTFVVDSTLGACLGITSSLTSIGGDSWVVGDDCGSRSRWANLGGTLAPAIFKAWRASWVISDT